MKAKCFNFFFSLNSESIGLLAWHRYSFLYMLLKDCVSGYYHIATVSNKCVQDTGGMILVGGKTTARGKKSYSSATLPTKNITRTGLG
jgi:hypothetical protein